MNARAIIVPASAKVLLERLVRLRVCTAPQAHLLNPAYARRSLRNAYQRLAGLVRQGWLCMEAVDPTRGAATAHYFTPSFRALRALGIEERVSLLVRPAEHVLEYLLFRAEVYARATADGWYLGSPIFLPKEKHAAALGRLHEFLKGRALERYKAAQARREAPAQLLALRTELERLPSFLPKELVFEFLYRVDPQTHHTTEVVLLLVDDVRRSVKSQVSALPISAQADGRILIRDTDSVFDRDLQALSFASPRLAKLRRAVTARFGQAFSLADPALGSTWARTTSARSMPVDTPSVEPDFTETPNAKEHSP